MAVSLDQLDFFPDTKIEALEKQMDSMRRKLFAENAALKKDLEFFQTQLEVVVESLLIGLDNGTIVVNRTQRPSF